MKKSGLLALIVLTGCTPQLSDLGNYLANCDFSGSALIVHDGQQILRGGYGLADRELMVPNTPDGIYRIGSLTKPLTAAALLNASEAGHLSLEDPVCSHLRVCPDEWHSVRVRHLLNHTSGIPDLFDHLDRAPLLETTSEIDRVLSALGSVPLTSAAGAEYRYSNFNYMLAGYVLEQASETDWNAYLQENVLRPAGALHTAYDDAWSLVQGRVHGYERRDNRVSPIQYNDHSAYAAGGLRSTVDDLKRFHDDLVGGEILSQALLDASFSPGLGNYGFGWQVVEILGRTVRNHTGSVGGFTSHLAFYPDDDLLIVLLSNVEDEDVKALACDLARIVLGTAQQPNPIAEWLDKPVSARCAQQSLRPPTTDRSSAPPAP